RHRSLLLTSVRLPILSLILPPPPRSTLFPYTTPLPISNYVWTVSSGGTITAGGGTSNNSATVTWTTSGSKTVSIVYTDANGCTRSEEHTSELQSQSNLVCRLLLEKKKKITYDDPIVTHL